MSRWGWMDPPEWDEAERWERLHDRECPTCGRVPPPEGCVACGDEVGQLRLTDTRTAR
jgi:uncharacterized OB-fold protein